MDCNDSGVWGCAKVKSRMVWNDKVNAEEAQMIMLAQSYLRGDHRLTYNELLEEIEHSKSRRFSLGATQSQIMLAGVER